MQSAFADRIVMDPSLHFIELPLDIMLLPLWFFLIFFLVRCEVIKLECTIALTCTLHLVDANSQFNKVRGV